MTKGIFAHRSANFQVAVFVYFLLFGLMLTAICGYVIMGISDLITGNTSGHTSDMPFYTMHFTQFTASLFLFALPAICTAYCCSLNPAKFLHAEKFANIKVLLLATLMLFLIFPAIDIVAYINSKMTLPDFMAPIEGWMREKEDLTANATERLLSEKGFFPFITNLLIIGVVAGITEELLFRGAVLSLIRQKIKNPHVAIWIVAILFSAIHFQFYGFIPRMILGAILGYLLYWNHSIWVPVFIHFLNNAIAVVCYNAGYNTENSLFMTDAAGTGVFLYMGVIAIVGLLLFGFCARKMKRMA
jgi:membrane protease YdiL (CAAX protease family)